MSTIKKKQKKQPTPSKKKAVKIAGPAAVVQMLRNRDRFDARIGYRNEVSHTTRLTLKSYRDAVINPFFAAQPKLGWGCYVPTSVLTGWVTTTPALNAGASAFCVLFQPNLLGTVAVTSVTFSSVLSSTTLTSAPTQTNQNMTNGTSLATLVDASRVISAAARISVRTASTQLRGTVGAVLLPYSSFNNIVALTYDAIRSLPSYREFSVSGEYAGGEVQYRAVDPTDFGFTLAHASGAAASLAQTFLAVVGTGWPPGAFAVDMSLIAHHETIGGLDAAAQDSISNSLADSGVTMDQAARSLLTEAPVIPSLTLLDSLENGLSHIGRNFPTFSGDFAGRMGVGTASSSSSSSNKPARKNKMCSDCGMHLVPEDDEDYPIERCKP